MNRLGAKKIFIAGCAAVDIQAEAFEKINASDSNPGKYSVSCGGVGRNVAVNCALLGFDVVFMSVVGDDVYGSMLVADFAKYGIKTSLLEKSSGSETAAYISLHEPDGEMYAAVSSMAVNERITPERVINYSELINDCDACFVETNLPENTLTCVTEICSVKLFLDTVSEHKSEKVISTIGKFHSVKPNLQQAEVLCGFNITGTYDLLKAAEYFHMTGTKNVFISMGKDGVFYSDCNNRGIVCLCEPEVYNVTGAGDAFVAGIMYADIAGFGIEDQAMFGTSAAAIVLASNESISHEFSVDKVTEIMTQKKINIRRF